jgi:hypothetical protein
MQHALHKDTHAPAQLLLLLLLRGGRLLKMQLCHDVAKSCNRLVLQDSLHCCCGKGRQYSPAAANLLLRRLHENDLVLLLLLLLLVVAELHQPAQLCYCDPTSAEPMAQADQLL